MVILSNEITSGGEVVAESTSLDGLRDVVPHQVAAC